MTAHTMLRASDVISALSLTLDVQKHGNLYHGWHVGLVVYAIAADMPPVERATIFYAALLHDVGNIIANQSTTNHTQLMNREMADRYTRNHPQQGATIVGNIPGLTKAEPMVKFHHEWWNGAGYPEGRKQLSIPLGAQYIRIADAADIAGAFNPDENFEHVLRQMFFLTGQEWSKDVWAKFLQIFADGSVTRAITIETELPELLAKVQDELSLIPELDTPETLETLFKVFARVIDSNHVTCIGHSERVAELALMIGQAMDLSDEDIQLLRWSAYAHDAGKIAVPKSLFDRSGKLSKEEIELVRAHATFSGNIFGTFNNCPVFMQIGEIVRHHHERFDGLGYPYGLAGKAIPMASRILAAADTYDAMTSRRTYRQGIMPEIAMQRLQLNAGTQFDPDVVNAISTLYKQNQKLFAA